MAKRWLVFALAATAAAIAVVAAWRIAARRPVVRRDPGLSVLLVSIDTLRADALGAYGQAGAATPWMDRLAREGVRFERAHAHNVVTLPSHANILSGRHPFEHGVRDNSGFRFPAGTPTLASILKARGWRTGAFVSAFPLDSRFGLDQGFETYDDRLGGREIVTTFVEPERAGSATVEAALAWQGAHRGERTLTFVHLYEPHFPYEPPQPFAARFRDRPYDGEVAAADAVLERLLRPILEQGASGRTLVVLTSDHGEALGDHGEATHGIFAYEATLRVPLVLYAPGLLRPGVVTSPVRHVDILPTILDALGIAPPSGLSGRSLLPLAAGRADASIPPTYFEALSPSLNEGWAPLHGLLDGSMKYVDLPLPELYDLDADPGETRNLAPTRAPDLERMRGRLATLRQSDRGGQRLPEDAATLERLRALGYAAGGAPAKDRYTDEDDPKRLIDIDARSREAIRRFRAGDLPGAIALYEENVRRRPGMPMAYLHLAYLQRARGDLLAAVASSRRAFDLQPLAPETAALYTVYLTESGRAKEAAAALEPFMAAAKPDLDVLTSRAMALATLRRPADAVATLERGRQVDPSNPIVLVNIGTVHLMAGDHTQARKAFDAALGIDPDLARAHNSLGVIAAQEGRMDEAVERWRRAAALDPADYQTLFNLGATLRAQGRAEEARPYLEAYLRAAPPALEARDIARVRAWLSTPGR